MKYMMIVCVASLAILGYGAYASEQEVLPSFAKDGEVTWLCYSEGGAMSGMDFAFVVDLEHHASGTFTGKLVRVVQTKPPSDGMTVHPADKWSNIVRLLEAADIPSWPDVFGNPTICDGSVWQLNLMKGTNVVRRIWRSNDAPPKFNEFYKIIHGVDGSEKNPFGDYFIRLIEKHGVEYRAKGSLDDALRDLDMKRGFRFWTDESTGLTWCYRLDEDGRIVLGDRTYAKGGCISPSPAGRLAIPDRIGGAPVCEILGAAFAGCSNVTEIVIPASVKRIDEYLCPWVPCRSLERIFVSPGNSEYCSIDGLLFERDAMCLLAYPQRSRSAIPPQAAGISSRAFARNEDVEKMDVPSAVRYVGSYAFDGCRRLREVSFPSNLPHLSSDGVFGGCASLGAVKVPRGAMCGEGFQSEKVFRGSSFLKQKRTWTDPSTNLGWTYLQYGDFASVVRVECPKGMACPVRVVVPETLGGLPVCWIEMCALSMLEQTSVVVLPASVVFFSKDATSESVAEIVVDVRNEKYRSADGMLLDGTGRRLLFVPPRQPFSVPEGVNEIDSDVFGSWRRAGVPTLVIPEGVETIGGEAFSGWRNLEELVLPSTIKNIGQWAFQDCSNLKKVVVPKGVEAQVHSAAFTDSPFERKWRELPGLRPEEWAVPMTCAGVPNLHKVSDKLYRSAQPTAEGMTNLVALGIKTVVNLRDNHSDSDEIGGLPLKARRIEIFTGNMKDKYVTEFLSILDDTNAVPVLVHCQHGADRTGTMCAMYRILREGWTADEAIDEMKNGGYGYHSVWGNLPRFIRKASERMKQK